MSNPEENQPDRPASKQGEEAEKEEQQPEEAAEQPEEESKEPQVESSEALAYIDINRSQRSRAKSPSQGMDEAGLLLRAGWKPYRPYHPTREGDKPYMYMQQAVGSKGRVFYVMARTWTTG